MPRHFNTAGPNDEAKHYTLPPLGRIPADLKSLVENDNYFVLHAPRQTGKTTSMKAFADMLRADGRWAVVYATLEEARSIAEVDPALRIAVDAIEAASRAQLPAGEEAPRAGDYEGAPRRLGSFLCDWCRQLRRPLVLILDEIDSLEGAPLMAVLSQLRAGYLSRDHTPFPASICLFGMRNIRDYKAASGGSPNIGTSSPFNVSREAVTVAFFSREEIAELYAQHTAETGQSFSDAAIDRAWQLTRGQPFLVNALADFVVRKQKWTGAIDVAQIDAAKELLILARVTHIDSLMARLREDRVRRVLEPMLAGTHRVGAVDEADVEYCKDLGLVVEVRGELDIANDMYREVIPRQLAGAWQRNMEANFADWQRPDGTIDLPVLMVQFADFWRRNGEWMVREAHWPEAAHQIVFMAFLQKIVNGGGMIAREFGVGRGRLDLLVQWQAGAVVQQLALEVKVWRDGQSDPLGAGLQQLDGYLGRLGLDEGTLVIFDARRREVPWEQRGEVSAAVTKGGRKVEVWRL
ncbi:MAG: ATP-binding protein [Deltaproteobacteria bacterium]|nr:ATP-binding protein [Deltaproteobacteria bacterium]